MRQARERQFDPQDPPWLHCISRCVRRAFLCGEGFEHRKQWIERRLELLARHCAVAVGAYAVMSNHLHVVLRPRPQAAQGLSDEQVVRAWWALRENEDLDADGSRASDPQVRGILDGLLKDAGFIARWRARLGSVSWFMKSVKEPLSRLANREDDCTGAFWEGRFRSVPLLDRAAVTTCMAYVDLNPIRAGLAQRPEDSTFTSIKSRIAARQAAAEHPWLTPVARVTASREGDSGLSLDEYLRLVDGVGRFCRSDKRGAIPSEVAGILQRLDGDLVPADWLHSMLRPQSLAGSALGKLGALAVEAQRRGMQWLQARCRILGQRSRGDTTLGA
ncbi:MAG: transposase [Planctomycetota bacterium]|nr:MAG: transposase [Planctomycetota bacterium]